MISGNDKVLCVNSNKSPNDRSFEKEREREDDLTLRGHPIEADAALKRR